MRHRSVWIRNWRLDMFIDDGSVDTERVIDTLIDMDAPFGVVRKAIKKMRVNKPNNAFTYSVWRWTCIFIGWTTSGMEFINSMVHEIRHFVDHVASAYDISPDGEAVGYLSGDTAFLLASDICELGCVRCRCNAKHRQND